jgi:cell division protein FtsL
MRRNLRKKEEKSSFHKIFVISLFALVCLALVYVWQRVEVVQLSKTIGDLKTQLAEQKKIYQYLSLDVADLSQGEWIEKIAVEKLDMHYSTLNQIQLIAEHAQPRDPELTLTQKWEEVKSNLVENLTVSSSNAVERE